MKIYFCASYARRKEMKTYAKELEKATRHIVMSSWVWDHDGRDRFDDGTNCLLSFAAQAEVAERDWQDISECDVFILFAKPAHLGYQRGNRHAEFGMAWALRQWTEPERPRIILIGEPELIFHHLPGVDRYATWEECKEALEVMT